MTSVCRLGKNELQQVESRFGFTHATENYQELLEIPSLQAVVIASPYTLHYQHALTALKRGLHVLCEKPLTTKADEARKLVEEAKRKMDAGAVGDIEFVMCHIASPIWSLLES